MLRTNGGAAEAAVAGCQGRRGALGARSWRDWLRVAVATLRLWSERHRSRRALALLDDSQLRDIGLTRIEARRESSLWFWRT